MPGRVIQQPYRLEWTGSAAALPVGSEPDAIVMIDDALTRLAAEDAQAAEIVKLRLFAGLSIEQAAEATGVSRASAYRHWTYARAWLLREIC